MQKDVKALLAVQGDDARIRELESRISELDPQLRDLDLRREHAATALARVEAAIQTEERRHRELEERRAQHKQLQDRNMHQLDDVKRLKEATAAMSQVETSKRMMAEDESEILASGRRIAELKNSVSAAQQALADVEQEQATAREEIGLKRTDINGELAAAREERNGKTSAVPKALLSKYDRIRGKRTSAIYPLQGGSCGHCDTSIPLQRRNMMASTGQIEICEACGVLLYADG